jgi:hypothetical protein
MQTELIHLKRDPHRRGITVCTAGWVLRRLTQAGPFVRVTNCYENTLVNLGVIGAVKFPLKWRNRFSEGDVRIFVYKLSFKTFK